MRKSLASLAALSLASAASGFASAISNGAKVVFDGIDVGTVASRTSGAANRRRGKNGHQPAGTKLVNKALEGQIGLGAHARGYKRPAPFMSANGYGLSLPATARKRERQHVAKLSNVPDEKKVRSRQARDRGDEIQRRRDRENAYYMCRIAQGVQFAGA